jgi:excisionase family DNA binding protein
MGHPGKLLTVREAAVRARQSPKSIRRKISRGEIPALRLGDNDRAPLRRIEDEFTPLWLLRDTGLRAPTG